MSSVKKNSKRGGEQKQKLTIISLLLGVFLTVAVIAFVTLLLIHLKVPTVDECHSHDCQYGACEADQSRNRGYRCNCKLGYVGDNCQVAVCESNDCKRGTCVADQSRIRGYTCNCTTGFVGDNCQVDVCDNHDCQNGTCVADQSRIRGYTCNCTNGFVGDNCQDEKRCDNCIEYVKNNSWILAFKAQSQTGINPVDVYKSVGIRHEVNGSYPLECTALKQIPGCFMPYRTGLIDDWEEINVNLVKFQVIIDDTKTQEVVFDGRSTKNINWFTASRILSSTWQDVTSNGRFNFFTIEGHQR
ncbi:uncharacterized protein LOC134270259 [Saccostrea cucullata]|uniref:uncharacterized protein LOC134270259 n=1 Tax=Saccostrea cuccullata TaxID=36930 RepID=UPI002ED3E358